MGKNTFDKIKAGEQTYLLNEKDSVADNSKYLEALMGMNDEARKEVVEDYKKDELDLNTLLDVKKKTSAEDELEELDFAEYYRQQSIQEMAKVNEAAKTVRKPKSIVDTGLTMPMIMTQDLGMFDTTDIPDFTSIEITKESEEPKEVSLMNLTEEIINIGNNDNTEEDKDLLSEFIKDYRVKYLEVHTIEQYDEMQQWMEERLEPINFGYEISIRLLLTLDNIMIQFGKTYGMDLTEIQTKRPDYKNLEGFEAFKECVRETMRLWLSTLEEQYVNFKDGTLTAEEFNVKHRDIFNRFVKSLVRI